MYRAAASFLIALSLAGAGMAQEAPGPPPPPATPRPAPAPRARAHVYRYQDETPSGRAYLGVDVSQVHSRRAQELKLKEARGVEVMMLDGDSPAAKAGLQEHDVIQSFDGKTIDDSGDLQRAINAAGPGKAVSIGIVRNGQPQTLKATLANREDMMSDMHINIPAMHIVVPHIPEIPAFVMMQAWRRSGVQVENLNTQLGEFFGVKNGEGVLVRSVDKGSRAEQGGLKAGDVIVRVGNQRVSGTDDFMRAMRDSKGGSVPMTVVRDRREQTLSVNLPPGGPGDGSEMRDLDIEIPSQEWAFNTREWSRQLRDSIRESTREWQREWQEKSKEWQKQQKEWQKQQKEWEKEWDKQ